MKHTKPFRCGMLGCKRQAQGFTSANDRDRHMNSVHKRSSGRGATGAVGYDCVYDHCRANGKIFWRLDNFRNHLKKKHGKEGELDEFLKRYVGFQVYPPIHGFGICSVRPASWNQRAKSFDIQRLKLAHGVDFSLRCPLTFSPPILQGGIRMPASLQPPTTRNRQCHGHTIRAWRPHATHAHRKSWSRHDRGVPHAPSSQAVAIAPASPSVRLLFRFRRAGGSDFAGFARPT